MAHIKIYIVSFHYLYRKLDGNYTSGNSDYSTPYLYTNLKKATGFISKIVDSWIEDGFNCTIEPADMNEKLNHFNKCIWEFTNILSEEKRVVILDPTLTD